MKTDIQDMVDIAFDLGGRAVPSAYAFTLWEEIVRVLPWLEAESSAGIIPLRGTDNGGEILLARRSKLVLRLPAACAGQAMLLCGRELHIGFHILSVGAGVPRMLQPYATLHSHLVETAEAEEDFLQEVDSQLQEMAVSCKLICGRHHSLSSGEHSLSGYSLVLHELGPEDSLQLQCTGLGNSRRFGCGIFLPYKTISGLD